jgi:hypothetical protein
MIGNAMEYKVNKKFDFDQLPAVPSLNKGASVWRKLTCFFPRLDKRQHLYEWINIGNVQKNPQRVNRNLNQNNI